MQRGWWEEMRTKGKRESGHKIEMGQHNVNMGKRGKWDGEERR